ncbi:hypothetical protein [Brevundimonas sp.]|jgi:hypothetical protein|uniref:hypothetical protein n=1 Tax=Brevundimonas sp. TaxID=1871086 RepID=UPI0037BF6BD6
MMTRIAAVLFMIVTWFCASATQAQEWKRAESQSFVVYSQGGSNAALTRYVQQLETFDYMLRYRNHLPLNTPPKNKLPIYLVANNAGLEAINPHLDRMYAGAYYPTLEGIFAVTLRNADQDYIFHEYHHHFAFQNRDGSNRPAWLIEGLAEYFMTVRISDRVVEIGAANPARLARLKRGRWIPLETLLTNTPDSAPMGPDRDSYYPVAWLLTHWLMNSPDGIAKRDAYMAAVKSGVSPVKAMTDATGLTMPQLEAALRAYLNQPMQTIRYEGKFPTAQVTVTDVPRSTGDALLLAQRLKFDLTRPERAQALSESRDLARLYPDDTFVQLQRARTEIEYGDGDEGERILRTLLNQDPANVDALQLMAHRAEHLARQTPAERDVHMDEARTYLAEACRANPNDAYTLYLMAHTRLSGGATPEEEDLRTLQSAFNLAPQVAALRIDYSEALIKAGKPDEAVPLLESLANSPHAGVAARVAQDILKRARRPMLATDAATQDMATTPAIDHAGA